MVTIDLKTEEQKNEQVMSLYRAIEQENQDLRDSLYYASSIQQGLMPQKRHLEKLNNKWFIFYQPVKIIGGDFYWAGKKNDWVYYAVGDCTGHSLSGAMLSSMAIGFLNYLIYSKDFTGVGEVLDELDKKWMETFTHDADEEVNNDWLEIALIGYNQSTKQFQFTSAKRKTVLINEKNEAQILNGNSYPIGGWQIEKNRKYTTIDFTLEKPFNVYLFSDGYQDQFGGFSGKRFGIKKLTELIFTLSKQNIQTQEQLVKQTFFDWKQQRQQTDDVCFMGVEFN